MDIKVTISVSVIDTTIGGLRIPFICWMSNSISCILPYMTAFIRCCRDMMYQMKIRGFDEILYSAGHDHMIIINNNHY